MTTLEANPYDQTYFHKSKLKSRIGSRYVDAKPDNLHGFSPGDSAYLFGSVGTGKTYLAAYLFQNNPFMSATCYSFARLLARLKSNLDSMNSLLTEIERMDYLFLDDIGASRLSDFAIEVLERIVDYRYNNQLPTLITSNLSLSELSKFDDRLASRIAGLCTVKEIKGSDRRLSK